MIVFLQAQIKTSSRMPENTFHIGNLIKEQVTQKGIKVSWLAKQLNCHRNNVYLIFSRRWIDTDTLMKISCILHHDFFADLSAWYKQKDLQINNGHNAK